MVVAGVAHDDVRHSGGRRFHPDAGQERYVGRGRSCHYVDAEPFEQLANRRREERIIAVTDDDELDGGAGDLSRLFLVRASDPCVKNDR
jgi:hypothetical protein